MIKDLFIRMDKWTAITLIGRNLNQLTTLCNMGKITALDLSEVKQGFGAVFDLLSKTAMGKVMRYVSQDKKTLCEHEGRQYKLLSGKDCCGDTAFNEFMATKRQYGKESGVYFYQYVQSFPPNEKATPQQIHQMGVELAEYFKGYEVLIATHIDRDHWHNHLIVNSVSHKTGLKLQFNEKNIVEFRNLSDKICIAHGLEVLKPYEKQKKKSLGQREYRAALRGDSWKFKLMGAIDKSMTHSRTKEEFIANMQCQGYQVKWEPHYKYITYTTPEGQKCRDNRLHDDKYLKMNMEGYYAEYGRTQKTQYSGGNADNAVSAADMRHTQGTMGSNAEITDWYGGENIGTELLLGESIGLPPRTNVQRSLERMEADFQPRETEYDRFDTDEFSDDDGYDQEYDWDDDEYADMEYEPEADGTGEYTPSQGYVGAKTKSQMGGNRGIDLDDILYLAKAVEDLVNPYDPQAEQEKKKQQKPKKQRKKKHYHSHDDYDMSL